MYQALLCLGLCAPAANPMDCPCPPKSACVAEPTVKKIPHVVYATKCTEYCLPHRSFIKTLLHCCDKEPECSRVRVKHVLVKKVITEEKCEMKCVPRPVDCAPAGK